MYLILISKGTIKDNFYLLEFSDLEEQTFMHTNNYNVGYKFICSGDLQVVEMITWKNWEEILT